MADAVTFPIPDRRAERDAARRARDQQRGYSISYKRLTLAFIIEGIIVATSLAGAWLFASIYAGTDNLAFWMMLLAPVAYGVIEFSRVPLAVSIRTQPSKVLRVIAAIGVIGAAAVTIKSISQLGEIMFRPRLTAAVTAQAKLGDAEAAKTTLDRKIADADAVVAQRATQLAEAEKRLKDGNTELGALPPQRCFRTVTTNRDGRRVTGTRCNTDPRMDAMKTSLSTAQRDRREASDRLDAARAERAKLDRTAIDRAASEAAVNYRDAVMHSQLHSFTGMVFFKDPGRVTDKEIHSFLFFFVFVPAVGASLAATLLALTAVERVRGEDDVVIDERAGSFILEPFADEIVRQAREEAERTARAAIGRTREAETPASPSAPAAPVAPASPPVGPQQPAGAPLRVVEAGR
jgi:hypothetical protein